MLSTSLWSRFDLTSVVIDTYYICSWKSNYLVITPTPASENGYLRFYKVILNLYGIYFRNIGTLIFGLSHNMNWSVSIIIIMELFSFEVYIYIYISSMLYNERWSPSGGNPMRCGYKPLRRNICWLCLANQIHNSTMVTRRQRVPRPYTWFFLLLVAIKTCICNKRVHILLSALDLFRVCTELDTHVFITITLSIPLPMDY